VVEIETRQDVPGGKAIPAEVLAAVLEVAEAMWYSEGVGWFVVDPEQIALVAYNVKKLLGSLVGAGESLDTAGVALVEKLTEEIEARTLASRGVDPKYYTVVVREPGAAAGPATSPGIVPLRPKGA
jgi:hypothetical protein